MVSFFKEVYRELKKVEWPTRQELIRLTGIVVLVSVVVGVYIGVIDITLAKLLESIIQ